MYFSFAASSCDCSSPIICWCSHSSQRSRPGNQFLAEWDNQRSLCSAALSREERSISERSREEERHRWPFTSRLQARKESVWRPNSVGLASVFWQKEENSEERSSLSRRVGEKSYLPVNRWVKAGVAVETSLITARLGDVLLKCSGHSIRSNSWSQENLR